MVIKQGLPTTVPDVMLLTSEPQKGLASEGTEIKKKITTRREKTIFLLCKTTFDINKKKIKKLYLLSCFSATARNYFFQLFENQKNINYLCKGRYKLYFFSTQLYLVFFQL